MQHNYLSKVFILLSALLVGCQSLFAQSSNKLTIKVEPEGATKAEVYTFEGTTKIPVSPQADGSYIYPERFSIEVPLKAVTSWTVNGIKYIGFDDKIVETPYLSSRDIKDKILKLSAGTPLSGPIEVVINATPPKRCTVTFGLRKGSPENSGHVSAYSLESAFMTEVRTQPYEAKPGTRLRFKAFPEEGFKIDKWYVNGILTKNEHPDSLDLAIDENVNVEVLFRASGDKATIPTITLTTAKAVGETINIATVIEEKGIATAWIDLNNNQTKDTGEELKNGKTLSPYTLGSQTITVHGKITEFYCENNRITNLDVSKNLMLERIECQNNEITSLNLEGNDVIKNLFICSNKIKGEAMTALINSLRPLEEKNHNKLVVLTIPSTTEENECSKADVELAAAKNWRLYSRNEAGVISRYKGPKEDTGNCRVEAPSVSLEYTQGVLHISHAPAFAVITVYNMKGEVMQKCQADETGSALLQLGSSQYIININNTSMKVAL